LIRLETSIEIDGTPDTVWDLFMKPDRYTEFLEPSDEMVDGADGIVKDKYIYTVRGGIPPLKSVTTWTMSGFKPKSREVHDGDDGKARIRASWTIAPTDTGSHLAHTVELEPVRYLAPVMAVMWTLIMRKRTLLKPLGFRGLAQRGVLDHS
jgi:hypothetical protein